VVEGFVRCSTLVFFRLVDFCSFGQKLGLATVLMSSLRYNKAEMDQHSARSDCDSQGTTLCTKCKLSIVSITGDYCNECETEYIYGCFGCEFNHDREAMPSVTLYGEEYCRKSFARFYEHLGFTLCSLAFPPLRESDPITDVSQKHFDLFRLRNMNDRDLDLHLIGILMTSNELTVNNLWSEFHETINKWEGDDASVSDLKRGQDDSIAEEPQKKKHKKF
jgi:hypothetical protein